MGSTAGAKIQIDGGILDRIGNFWKYTVIIAVNTKKIKKTSGKSGKSRGERVRVRNEIISKETDLSPRERNTISILITHFDFIKIYPENHLRKCSNLPLFFSDFDLIFTFFEFIYK